MSDEQDQNNEDNKSSETDHEYRIQFLEHMSRMTAKRVCQIQERIDRNHMHLRYIFFLFSCAIILLGLK